MPRDSFGQDEDGYNPDGIEPYIAENETQNTVFRCLKCGGEIRDNERFCQSCGRPLNG